MSDNDALEVSTMVWFDDEVESWVYSVMSSYGEEETIIAWGEEETRAKAATAAVRELTNYISGV